MDCLFCKIIKGEIPSAKIYENGKIFAFLDINPVNHGHALVIPKEHYSNLLDTPEDVLDEMIRAVKKLAPAIMRATGTDGFNLGVNNGQVAGQLILHTHFHIMPRREGDGFKHWHGEPYQEGEREKLAEKIREELKV
jgi:histidine triad (HIT) family protein